MPNEERNAAVTSFCKAFSPNKNTDPFSAQLVNLLELILKVQNNVSQIEYAHTHIKQKKSGDWRIPSMQAECSSPAAIFLT